MMELLPVELREKIFDQILLDNPTKLFSLRHVSKTWRIYVNQYAARFEVWHNLCEKQIPEECFIDIAESRAPLKAYPWQDSFWMRSRLPTVPREVYLTWNNLPSLMLQNFRITEFPLDFVPSSCHHQDPIITVEDKYIAVSFEAPNQPKTHIFSVENLSTPIRTFDVYSRAVNFFTANGTRRILLDVQDDLYLADFLANDQLSFSGLCLDETAECFVVANECFTADDSTRVITHCKFDGGRFHPSEKITMPQRSSSRTYLHSIYMRGSELRVFLFSDMSPTRTVWMYRYKVTSNLDGKLSFAEDESNFFEAISCNLSDSSDSRAVTACFATASIIYVKSASLLLSDFELHEMVNSNNFRQTLATEDEAGNRRVWYTLEEEISSAAFHANYLVLGTTTGSVWIYQMKNIHQIVESVEANSSPPRFNVINLTDGTILGVYIRYVGLKLRIIAESDSIYFIDFPGGD